MVKSTMCLFVVLAMIVSAGCQVGESSPEYSLSRAASAGDTELVLELVEAGANASGEPGYEGYPLENALMSQQLSIADILFENGADVNVASSEGGSLLDVLIRRMNESNSQAETEGLERSIEWLYDHGAKRHP